MSSKAGKRRISIDRAWERVSREAANVVADGQDLDAMDHVQFDAAVMDYAVALGIHEARFARHMEHALERKLKVARRTFDQCMARNEKLAVRLFSLAHALVRATSRIESNLPSAWYEADS